MVLWKNIAQLRLPTSRAHENLLHATHQAFTDVLVSLDIAVPSADTVTQTPDSDIEMDNSTIPTNNYNKLKNSDTYEEVPTHEIETQRESDQAKKPNTSPLPRNLSKELNSTTQWGNYRRT